MDELANVTESDMESDQEGLENYEPVTTPKKYKTVKGIVKNGSLPAVSLTQLTTKLKSFMEDNENLKGVTDLHKKIVDDKQVIDPKTFSSLLDTLRVPSKEEISKIWTKATQRRWTWFGSRDLVNGRQELDGQLKNAMEEMAETSIWSFAAQSGLLIFVEVPVFFISMEEISETKLQLDIIEQKLPIITTTISWLTQSINGLPAPRGQKLVDLMRDFNQLRRKIKSYEMRLNKEKKKINKEIMMSLGHVATNAVQSTTGLLQYWKFGGFARNMYKYMSIVMAGILIGLAIGNGINVQRWRNKLAKIRSMLLNIKGLEEEMNVVQTNLKRLNGLRGNRHNR